METHSRQALTRARKLRREMSLPEGMLWHRLRQRPAGIKFRKQHPIGSYVVDFYCASKRLVIEVDGLSHEMGGTPQTDLRREAWLREQGYDLVRVTAREVLKNPAEVAQSLVAYCGAMPPPSALRAATSPKGGEPAGAFD